MNKSLSVSQKQSLWQVLALTVMAGVIAISVNALRSDGIALIGDWTAEGRIFDDAGKSLMITLDQAKQLFEQGEALFVDARPRDQYVQGHIRGALSLPWQDLDAYFDEVADQLDTDKTIVTYCDGETCELSHDLALFLKDAGFKHVQVLVNGWTVWQDAGLATDVEEERHEQ